MRAAHGLHGTCEQAEEQRCGEPAQADLTPASRSALGRQQPRQAQRHKRKTTGGMTAWKAPPGTAVDLAPGPVRHVLCDAAESAQIPGATGETGVFHQVDREQRQAHQRHHQPAFPSRQGQPGPQRPDDQQQPGDRHCVAQAVVQHRRQQPGVAQRKTLGGADRLHRRQIQAGCVKQQREGQQARQPDSGAGEVHGPTLRCPG